MAKSRERDGTLPLASQEQALYCGGGKKYGEEALAQNVVNGRIPPEQIRKVVGVDKNGNPIYHHPLGEGENSPPHTFFSSSGKRHRQPPRGRK